MLSLETEIDLILTLLTEIKKEDKDFQDYILASKIWNLNL